MPPLRVLVVDDETSIADLFGLVFEGGDWALTIAGSAEAAIEKLKTEGFDLIALDKNLPGMNGIELLAVIRQHNPIVPVVVMTAFASAQSAFDALNLRVDLYLEKPFERVAQLPGRFREIISKHPGSAWIAPAVFGSPAQAARGKTDPGRRPFQAVLFTQDPQTRASVEALLPAEGLALATRDDLMRLCGTGPDLVILDADLVAPVAVVRDVLAVAPAATIALVTTALLPHTITIQLIELGVTALFPRVPPDAFKEKLVSLLSTLSRARRAVSPP